MNNKNIKFIVVSFGDTKTRVNCEHDWTIGDIIDIMIKSKKLSYKKDELTLIQMSKNLVLSHDMLINSMNISDGENFQLNLPSKDFVESNSKGNFKNMSEFMEANPVIQTSLPNYFKKKIKISLDSMIKISRVCKLYHFNSTRVFLCYGTKPNENCYRVHCVSFPMQSYNGSNLYLDPDMISASDRVAHLMKLRLVAVAFMCEKTEKTTLSPKFFMSLLMALNPERLKDCVLLKIKFNLSTFHVRSMDDVNAILLDGYLVSQQFFDLYNKKFFSNTIIDEKIEAHGIASCSNETFKSIDLDLFLIPILVDYSGKTWFTFSSFPFQAFYPTKHDFARVLAKQFNCPDFFRCLDFNFLIYLESLFKNNIDDIIHCCINKLEFPASVVIEFDRIFEGLSRDKLDNR